MNNEDMLALYANMSIYNECTVIAKDINSQMILQEEDCSCKITEAIPRGSDNNYKEKRKIVALIMELDYEYYVMNDVVYTNKDTYYKEQIGLLNEKIKENYNDLDERLIDVTDRVDKLEPKSATFVGCTTSASASYTVPFHEYKNNIIHWGESGGGSGVGITNDKTEVKATPWHKRLFGRK